MNQTADSIFSKKASLSFRGIAILMVMLSHYAEWWSWFYTLEGGAETFRHFLAGLGPYGVAVFLLFSGYGLTKSAGDNRIGLPFILKRFFSVYIPYLIVDFIRNLLSNSLQTEADWLDMLIGDDFWYMTILFLFYIAFMIIWLAFKNKHLRAGFLLAATLIINYFLITTDKQDFWFISNYAFLIGVLLALYEKTCKRVIDILGVYLAIAFGIASIFAMRNDILIDHTMELPEVQIKIQIYMVLIFLCFIIFMAAKWRWYDVVTVFLGKHTLYLYLIHTFIFMWAVNFFTFEISLRFLVAFVITLLVSVILQFLFSFITKKCIKPSK